MLRLSFAPAARLRVLTYQAFFTFQLPRAARSMSTAPTTHPSLTRVVTEHAPAAIGPYSQAIVSPPFVFVSGCLGFNPATGAFVEGGVEAQARQALRNLQQVVEASGSSVGRVVKTTVFLKNMDDFGAVNKIYEEFFGEHKPARSLVEVARIPRDGLFEIEAIASVA
ncbi:Endoribonuclease L-PSP/chorismate mutase-like protein [Gloeopeniophorella convolvens]|nr:Endoribonuclease L-PSP/chorismate mutase-like protein [Gloeopeniophorella convolvens]